MSLDLPVLDRIAHFDERSRSFGVRQLIGDTPRYKRVWAPRIFGPLDQGREGACVGFAWAGELAATPHKHLVDNESARAMYELARAEDRAMGNHFPEGASILAGAKAVRTAGYVVKYHWAFGIDDVIDCLVRKGPVILGINWYASMYETNAHGLVEIHGPIVGGHAIMAHGYWPNHPDFGDCIVWTNSWGIEYGLNGRGYIRVNDLKRLLHEDGEACIPTDVPVRKLVM